MVGGTIMAYLGGLHYWWPKMTGRMYPEWLAKIGAAIIFVGFNLTFFPQFILGYLGHAAALPRVSAGVPGAERDVVGRARRSSASATAADGLFDLVAAVRPAGRPNPWGATGLEWTTTSPPPTENFAETPVVDLGRVRLSDAGGGPCCLNARRGSRTSTPPALAHHFDNLEQQHEASTLGMWVFLVTEVLFFGGLFADLRRLPQLVSGGVRRGQPRARRRARRRSTPWS